MNTRQILSIVLVMLGTIAAILPSKTTKFRKYTKEELEIAITKDTYYLTTDELTHLIITGDPSIQLIDIRAEADSMLVGAMHIPADSLLSEKYEGVLYQNVRKTILYGYETEDVIDYWKQLKYEGYPGVYMLKGGLRAWKDHILNPEYPGVTASQSEIDLYNRRLAARLYFTGAKTLPKTEFNVIIPIGGGKKKKVEGGCS